MLPKANLKYGSLLWDVRNKKLSFLIKPGVFNNSIPGYSMRVERKGEGAIDSLYGIMIYDHSSGNGIPQIIMAEKGKMSKTSDGNYMVLNLVNGVRYQEAGSNNGAYNPRQTLTRMRFKQTEVKFDFSSFKDMTRTQEQNFKNNAPMLNRKELLQRRDSLSKGLDSIGKVLQTNAQYYFKQSTTVKGYSKVNTPAKTINGSVLDVIPKDQKVQALQSAFDQIDALKQTIKGQLPDYEFRSKEVLKAKIEYQRKYTLAVSCLLLFFIGAPLGAIIRKGGLGLPVVIAVIFFLVYHIISTVAEKSAKEGSLDPVIGMWMAVIILTPVGVFLTYKATVDSALFDLDYYKQLIVVENGITMGLAGFWIGTKLWCGKYLEIDNFVVNPDHRSKGIGKLLTDYIEKKAIELNCSSIVLDAFTGNFGAHRFYYNQGYAPKGFHFVKILDEKKMTV